jgi:hypothetical protein
MDTRDQLVSKILNRYYPFAFFLISDELQATQLIVDVTTSILVEDREMLLTLDTQSNHFNFLSRLYQLARRRVAQVGTTSDDGLDLFQRACVFLEETFSLSPKDVEMILGEGQDKIKVQTIVGRQLLNEYIQRNTRAYAENI